MSELLAIVPPYPYGMPPFGMACLFGYLRENGCELPEFADLRLVGAAVNYPASYTYRTWGVHGDNFVIDVPDLPLVLRLLAEWDGRRTPHIAADPVLEEFALRRAINVHAMLAHFRDVDGVIADQLAARGAIAFAGFSVWASNYTTTLAACMRLKLRDKPPFIVLGGPQVTESRNAARLALLSGLADAVCVGEGEQPLLALLLAVRAGKTIEGIPGIITQNTLDTAAPRPAALPHSRPDFTPMAVDRYQTAGSRCLPIEATRGCTDKCEFCSEWVAWSHWRPRATDETLDEITRLIGEYGATELAFADSLLNASPRRLDDLLHGMRAIKKPFRWFAHMRANVSPDTAALMRKTGCQRIFVGVESLDTITLADMRKRRRAEDNLDALQHLLNARIMVTAGIVAGFPTDTPARFNATVRRFAALERDHPGMLRASVEPWSLSPRQPVYNRCGDFGLELHPWSNAVLGIAPAYEAVTCGIPERVTGPNQGHDRTAAAHMARMVLCR